MVGYAAKYEEKREKSARPEPFYYARSSPCTPKEEEEEVERIAAIGNAKARGPD